MIMTIQQICLLLLVNEWDEITGVYPLESEARDIFPEANVDELIEDGYLMRVQAGDDKVRVTSNASVMKFSEDVVKLGKILWERPYYPEINMQVA